MANYDEVKIQITSISGWETWPMESNKSVYTTSANVIFRKIVPGDDPYQTNANKFYTFNELVVKFLADTNASLSTIVDEAERAIKSILASDIEYI